MEELLRFKSQMMLITNKESYNNQLERVIHIHETLIKFSFSKYWMLTKRPEMLKIMSYYFSRTENLLNEDKKLVFRSFLKNEEKIKY